MTTVNPTQPLQTMSAKQHPFAPGVIDIDKPPPIPFGNIIFVIVAVILCAAVGGLLAGLLVGWAK